MTLLDAVPHMLPATLPEPVLSVVLCGSYRRDPVGLRHAYADLRRRFNVLSPSAVEFVDPFADFVRLPDEVGQAEVDIEDRHLAALRAADLMWLHVPDGYVGTSAAMELGEAVAVGIPIFSATAPADAVLASRVTIVPDPDAITPAILEEVGLPGRGLDRLQRYYRTTAQRRGWSSESARDTLLLLTEELGELARAVRKIEGVARHQAEARVDVGAELADVQLYLVHLANGLGLDLSQAVTDKERVNARRFEQSRVA